ncbi:glycerol transporter [Streptomyces avermitilis]|uniref:Glycerol uptake facilitator protein n=2 Tax=Streptomyces avermitilis TaxID=33903 RepID=Q827G0_STRAW|nr:MULTISPECIES: MIP/aquaporin family protein [Streptomyces]KUN53505.1 glycerol transporter [Streptomyces avermitilis]MYT02506.1 MIP family channel protein [Streptomyces sp. SID5469]OOV30053.1 aquaporin family protein [Streptomyces avermitilis]BAC74675.1 putative glycerol uptake facilitator protein [Streptomyces avermitilis MA-4680 = NBRC 14893]BBJ55268.1 putative glycerol uptake facilitator protein [Streptomyces avermitilis]
MSNGDIFVGEIIGTAILILFGAGVCAAVTLRYSKARASGWVVIAFGWGFGVLAGAYTAAPLSGGHLNPAVTIGIAIDTGTWGKVWIYLLGQLVGAVLGAVLAYLVYLAQFQANVRKEGTTEGTADEPVPTLGIFSTIPEIRNPVANLITEIIATIALVLPILAFGLTKGLGESGITVLIVSLLVVGIGLSLGGPTGYAINPARDLGPRIVHTFLPIPNKGTSDWGYAWIPVVGPLIGGALAGLIYHVAF